MIAEERPLIQWRQVPPVLAAWLGLVSLARFLSMSSGVHNLLEDYWDGMRLNKVIRLTICSSCRSSIRTIGCVGIGSVDGVGVRWKLSTRRAAG